MLYFIPLYVHYRYQFQLSTCLLIFPSGLPVDTQLPIPCRNSFFSNECPWTYGWVFPWVFRPSATWPRIVPWSKAYSARVMQFWWLGRLAQRQQTENVADWVWGPSGHTWYGYKFNICNHSVSWISGIQYVCASCTSSLFQTTILLHHK